jgi:hypothetical protein
MDALTYIIALMTAIVFTWVGYFLGNFFPIFGQAKKARQARQEAGRSLVDLGPLRRAFGRLLDWLLEREPQPEAETELDTRVPSEAGTSDPGQPEAISTTPKQSVMPAMPEELGDDAVSLWHDRRQRKLIAQVGKDRIDLDQDLSEAQRSALSMLLVDLQDRVGVSATIREALAQDANRAVAEQDRKRLVPKKDEEIKPPSLNPLRTFVNYVQADAPKLESASLSIPEQIDAYLQDLIEGTPLASRGISVADWPKRGVVFIVGVEVYDDIQRIPDPEVQKAIRAAVKMWEDSREEES